MLFGQSNHGVYLGCILQHAALAYILSCMYTYIYVFPVLLTRYAPYVTALTHNVGVSGASQEVYGLSENYKQHSQHHRSV